MPILFIFTNIIFASIVSTLIGSMLTNFTVLYLNERFVS